jgi:hypothetical protein
LPFNIDRAKTSSHYKDFFARDRLGMRAAHAMLVSSWICVSPLESNTWGTQVCLYDYPRTKPWDAIDTTRAPGHKHILFYTLLPKTIHSGAHGGGKVVALTLHAPQTMVTKYSVSVETLWQPLRQAYECQKTMIEQHRAYLLHSTMQATKHA